MSHNIHIRANRKAYYEDKQGMLVPFQTSEDFTVWQTRTKDTRWILEGMTPEDKLLRYCEYIKKENRVETEFEYDENDTWCEEPIGSKEANLSELHIKELEEWVKTKEDNCFTIEVYSV